MKRAKYVRRGNGGKVVSILTILLLFALFLVLSYRVFLKKDIQFRS